MNHYLAWLLSNYKLMILLSYLWLVIHSYRTIFYSLGRICMGIIAFRQMRQLREQGRRSKYIEIKFENS